MIGETQFRTATASDLPDVLQIAEESPFAPQWPAAQFRQMLDEQHPDANLRRCVLVAVSATHVVGFAVGLLLCAVSPPEAELESIVVSQLFRGKGIGKALIDAVIAWALDGKADRLRLEVRVGNSAALRLYTRHGFASVGKRPRYYTQPEEDALCLERTLP
ncbi:MAG: GNAT family N-acetyltransferase [Janthinobacterium lividum]